MVPRYTLLTILIGLVSTSALSAAPPNVVFIGVDDLRPILGCYGADEVQSPNIDRLARRGVLFERAYCQAPQCGPSRVSLLTGLRPETTGVYTLKERFHRDRHPGIVTLPEHFRRHGYHTQSFGKIYHDDRDDPASWSVPSTPGRKGEMYEYVDLEAALKLPFAERAKLETIVGKPRLESDAIQAPPVPDDTMFAGRMTAQAVDTLAQFGAGGEKSKTPFFLAVGYRRPHLPWVAPRRYFEQYSNIASAIPPQHNPPADAPIWAFFNSSKYFASHWQHVFGVTDARTPSSVDDALRFASSELCSYRDFPITEVIPPAKQAAAKQAYLACISYVDAQIGRLLDALDRLALSENTIIILWSDHGWHLGEHGIWGKLTNYEWSTRVPLIVATPDTVNAGAKTTALVELIDIYPTLCELADLPTPVYVEGTSFRPLLEQPDRPWKRAAFSQYPRATEVMGRAIRTDRYRYVEWRRQSDESVAARELYDHQTDPGETINLAGQPAHAETVADLAAKLSAGWKASLPHAEQ